MRILIVAYSLDVHGGIGNCLYRMIEAIITHEPNCQIDLLLSYPESIELAKKAFPTVKVLPQNEFINTSKPAKELIKDALKGKNMKLLWARLLYKFDYKLPMIQAAVEDLPNLEGEYDVAISYSTIPSPIASYVAQKVNAKKKIAWAHIEINQSICSEIPGFSSLKVRGLKNYQTILSKYDDVISVSTGVQASVELEFPQNISKKQVIHNLTGKQRVVQLADEYLVERGSELQLLTVGRCTYEKGIDIAVKAAGILNKCRLPFHWWFVGYGNNTLPNQIKIMIKKNGLEGQIDFLGPKENPYPYFKSCDIYVHTSRVEGYCTTVNEARMLGKPVITTNTAGADEQIYNGINGFVVPKDHKEIANAIISLANDPKQMREFSEFNNALDFEKENKESIEQILKLLKSQ